MEPPLLSYLYSAPLVQRAAEPVPVDELDVLSERKLLADVLDQAGRAVSFRGDVACTSNFLRELSATVLHVTGHGMPGEVTFETKKGELHAVNREALSRLVASSAARTRLVFVSACHSESVANVFVAAGIPHVVAVAKTDEVLDAASLEFARGFYRLLLEGRSVGSAFAGAQAQLAESADIPNARSEGAKFMLLGHGDQNEAPFASLRPGPWLDRSPAASVNHCDSIAECFVGRHVEVHKVFALLVEGARLVSVTGMRGIGKTQVALRAAAFAATRHVYHTIFYLPLQTQTARDTPLEELLAGAFGLHDSHDLLGALRARCVQPHEYLLVVDGAEEFLGLGEDEGELLPLLAALLDRVPALSLLVTAVHPLSRLANVVERIVPLGPMRPVNAAQLFTLRSPRKLRWPEILSGRPNTRTDRTRSEVLTELCTTPVLRALGGHPGAICDVSRYLIDKDLLTDQAFLLTLVPGILSHCEASLGLSPAERPRLGHSQSETVVSSGQARHHAFLSRRPSSMSLAAAGAVDPSVAAALGADGVALWGRAGGAGGEAQVPWASLAAELAAHFHRVLPQESQTRPLDGAALEFMRTNQRIWGEGADASAVVTLDMFAAGWKWFSGVLHSLSLTGLWGHEPQLIHGFLTAADAAALLRGGQPGTFLIRFSEGTVGALVVAFVTPRGDVSQALLRSAQGEGYDQPGFLAPVDGSQPALFASLGKFVRQCQPLHCVHPAVPKREFPP